MIAKMLAKHATTRKNMNLRGLISVSGKPGLFKLVGKNKSGFILESLDEQKTKIIVSMATSKIASLEDITVFTNDADLKLVAIFEHMKDAKSIPDAKSVDKDVLHKFFGEVAPQYDTERVYLSDIKKIINWFNIIKELPLFTEDAPEPLSDDSLVTSANEVSKKPDTQTHNEKQKPIKAAAKSATRLSQKSK